MKRTTVWVVRAGLGVVALLLATAPIIWSTPAGLGAREEPAKKPDENKLRVELLPCASLLGKAERYIQPPAGKNVQKSISALPSQLWTSGTTLYVAFQEADEAHATERAEVKKIAPEWTGANRGRADITFEFGTAEELKGKADILITFDCGTDGVFDSLVGTDSRESAKMGIPSMRLSQLKKHLPELRRRYILHEFGHALGLEHEHQHPVATAQLDEEAVKKYYKERLKWSDEKIKDYVLTPFTKDTANFGEFDAASIMMYDFPRELMKDKNNPNFEKVSTVLSPGDIKGIASLYPQAPENGANYKQIQATCDRYGDEHDSAIICCQEIRKNGNKEVRRAIDADYTRWTINTWEKGESHNQYWSIKKLKNGNHLISNLTKPKEAVDDYVLDADEAHVYQDKCVMTPQRFRGVDNPSSLHQQWEIWKHKDKGYLVILNAKSKKAIDFDKDDKEINVGSIRLIGSNNTLQQQFEIIDSKPQP